ncbi:MAG: hypothetical protein KKA62_05995 [Nanoarchaeota archaeon]|nr:hypothetical protein [Nanoarchaeota archaeon]
MKTLNQPEKNNNEKFLKYCIDNLNLNEEDQFEKYFSCVPLCVINAIFSINTKYEAVENAIDRFCRHFKLEIAHTIDGQIPSINKQKSVSDIYKLIKDIDVNILATDIFQNRQRTSTSNGILKSDASIRFIKILKDFGVEYYQDIHKLFNNDTFEDCIKRIPGQSSGISLKYFFMLTGSKDQIKPDRMVLSFIKDAIGLTLTPVEALDLVRHTVEDLKKKGYEKINARHLDNLIWNYQRNQKSAN